MENLRRHEQQLERLLRRKNHYKRLWSDLMKRNRIAAQLVFRLNRRKDERIRCLVEAVRVLQRDRRAAEQRIIDQLIYRQDEIEQSEVVDYTEITKIETAILVISTLMSND